VALEGSLMVLSDVLQCPLVIENKKLTGEARGTFTPDPAFSLPLHVRAVQFFAEEAVGVLCHVAGDLWVMAAHLDRTQVVSCFLIDASKLGAMAPNELLHSSMGIRDAVQALRPAIRASFVRKDKKWQALKLPK